MGVADSVGDPATERGLKYRTGLGASGRHAKRAGARSGFPSSAPKARTVPAPKGGPALVRSLTVGYALWFSQIPMLLIQWELSAFRQFYPPAVLSAFLASALSLFRTRAALQLEILALRHQLGVLQRSVKRPKLTRFDRMLWAWFCGTWAAWRSALCIVKPDTVIAWHRKGFRLFWTGKVRRGQPGRPAVPKEIRKLIRKMSRENPLWGAPRIHGELLKLGIDIGETSVSKYMVRR